MKDWIGGVAFAIYLWSQSLTADEYFDLLERDAEHRRAVDHAAATEACDAEKHHDEFAEGGHNFCYKCGKRLLPQTAAGN